MRFFTLILITVSTMRYSFGCCAFEEDITLTERLLSPNPGIIFTCLVLSSSPIPDNIISSTNNYPGITRAKVIKVFFGKIDSSVITIHEAGIPIGKILLIYCEHNRSFFSYGGICERWSKEVSNKAEVKYELQLLEEFSEIYKKRKTGNFSFINQNQFTLAEGRFQKGEARGLWKHYYPNTCLIKSKNDFKHNITTKYSLQGIITERITLNKKNTIYEYFNTNVNEQLSSKHIMSDNDSFSFVQHLEYFDNGNLKIKSSEILFKAINYHKPNKSGMTGLYEEYFENGQLKFSGLYMENKRIGIWRLFQDNGKIEKEIDFKDGIGTQNYWF